MKKKILPLMVALILGLSTITTYGNESSEISNVEIQEVQVEEEMEAMAEESAVVEPIETTQLQGVQPFADPVQTTVTSLADLQDAIDNAPDNAPDGSFITVSAAGTLEDTINIKKTININFTGGTIVAPENKTAFAITSETSDDIYVHFDHLDLVGNGYVNGNGGGIYVEGDSVNLNVENSKFEGFKAEKGGAVYFDAKGIHITQSEFCNNTAKLQGGAIWIKSAKYPTVSFSDMKWNYTTDDVAGVDCGGGAIYNDAPWLYIVGSNLTENGMNSAGEITTPNGGAIYFANDSYSSGSLHGGELIGNAAIKHGGGLYAECELNMSAPTISQCYTTLGDKSEAYGGGGMYYLGGLKADGTPVTLSGYMTITDNGKNPQGEITTPNGGGIMIANEVIITDTAFISGNSALYGGALYTSKFANVQINISNNYAEIYGGAVYATGPISMMEVTENKAGQAGGGLYIGSRNGEKITIGINEEQGFYNHIGNYRNNQVVDAETGEPTGYGGAIALSNVEMTLWGECHFNSAEKGGGIAVLDGSIIHKVSQSITNNTASLYGGGMYIEKGSNVSVSCYVANNTASEGGGFYVQDYNDLVVEWDSVHMGNNKADSYIHWELTDNPEDEEYKRSQIHKDHIFNESRSNCIDENCDIEFSPNEPIYNNYDVNYLELKEEEPPVEPEKPKPTPDEETEEPGDNGGNNNGGNDNGDNNGSNNGGDNNSNNGNNNGSETDTTAPDSGEEVETDVTSPEENVVAEDDKPYTEFDENDTPLGIWKKNPETGEWIFIPFEAVPTTNAPATGDTSNIMLYLFSMMISILAFVFFAKRKES